MTQNEEIYGDYLEEMEQDSRWFTNETVSS